jgi:hypothetical protein
MIRRRIPYLPLLCLLGAWWPAYAAPSSPTPRGSAGALRVALGGNEGSRVSACPVRSDAALQLDEAPVFLPLDTDTEEGAARARDCCQAKENLCAGLCLCGDAPAVCTPYANGGCRVQCKCKPCV